MGNGLLPGKKLSHFGHGKDLTFKAQMIMSSYKELKNSFIRGWNTWNSRSLACQVLQPEGAALNIGFLDRVSGRVIRSLLIGQPGEREERVKAGPRAYNGYHTDMEAEWSDNLFRVRTAHAGGDDELVIIISPEPRRLRTPAVLLEGGVLWGREGTVWREDDHLRFQLPGREFSVYTTGNLLSEPDFAGMAPNLTIETPDFTPVVISTHRRLTLEEALRIVESRAAELDAESRRHGGLADLYEPAQRIVSWNTIYDPMGDRVITTVSRIWNNHSGGWGMYCWDNFFAGIQAAIGCREIAYSNVIEILREKTEGGFVPNGSFASGRKSNDRSQPPVGGFAVWELYSQFKDRWLLEETYQSLLEWNRWWERKRDVSGYLCWGSNAAKPVLGMFWEHFQRENHGAVYESGMDNSPLYDDVGYDQKTECLDAGDVGLMGLYVMDCESLSKIAAELKRDSDVEELNRRAEKYRSRLRGMWDDETAFFYNVKISSGEPCRRLCPTGFFALLGGAATPAQARRMVDEHFSNPSEFHGDWMIPSIARNDPAFHDQNYWRGRIWPPINFLTYIALKKYGLNDAAGELADKSAKLLLKEWVERGHIHENYCPDTGNGCGNIRSDAFLLWGGLLAVIGLMERGALSSGTT
jgi:hypothetical protein